MFLIAKILFGLFNELIWIVRKFTYLGINILSPSHVALLVSHDQSQPNFLNGWRHSPSDALRSSVAHRRSYDKFVKHYLNLFKSLLSPSLATRKHNHKYNLINMSGKESRRGGGRVPGSGKATGRGHGDRAPGSRKSTGRGIPGSRKATGRGLCGAGSGRGYTSNALLYFGWPFNCALPASLANPRRIYNSAGECTNYPRWDLRDFWGYVGDVTYFCLWFFVVETWYIAYHSGEDAAMRAYTSPYLLMMKAIE